MIRFITVKDATKVDSEPTYEGKENFDQYLEVAKANRQRKLRQLWYELDGWRCSGYGIFNIRIPQDTEVITFSGDGVVTVGGKYWGTEEETSERPISVMVHFEYEDPTDESYHVDIESKHLHYRFMLKPRPGSSTGKQPIKFYIAIHCIVFIIVYCGIKLQ